MLLSDGDGASSAGEAASAGHRAGGGAAARAGPALRAAAAAGPGGCTRRSCCRHTLRYVVCAVFLVYREPGEYNWMLGCSRPGLSPPGRVTNSRLAAGPQFYRGANLAVNCSCSGTFGNDYVYKMVIGTYILKDIYL